VFSALLILIALIHFVAYVALQAIGRVVGARLRRRDDEVSSRGLAVEGSLFALLGLLVAFTFAGGQDRLDARRRLIVDEAAAMGTAYARIDLVSSDRQEVLRELLRQYVDARIAYYRTIVSDRTVAKVQHARAEELQQRLWAEVTSALAAPPRVLGAAVIVAPAFNQMFDVTIARDVALRTHLPLPVFLLLEVLALTCAFFAGLDMGRNGNFGWMHVLTFALALAVTAYVIADLEFPRVGLSQLAGADQALVHVRAGM
jgi:hypothetical protein